MAFKKKNNFKKKKKKEFNIKFESYLEALDKGNVTKLKILLNNNFK